MKKPDFIKVMAVLVALVAIASAGVLVDFRNSRNRVETDHGVRLPDSASEFECRGDAARGFLDRGASSAFIIDKSDLSDLLTQLTIRPDLSTFIPGNSKYVLSSKWRQGAPLATYSCASSVGDWLHVELWVVDGDNIGVSLYTDWN